MHRTLRRVATADHGAFPSSSTSGYATDEAHVVFRVVDEVEAPASVRLAELVAALSLGIDLGFGQPMGHVLRQCRIALRLGDLVGLDEEARATLYYTALLRL